MFFQITDLWQILGWCLVFAGLILVNESAVAPGRAES